MLAIIPARGGSKGLPGKNIKLFGGQPLICHTIEVAKSSSLISRIVVSTDNEEIASISSAAGAEVPFLRPSEFATDTSMAIDAYFYTIDNLSPLSESKYQSFVALLPTVPLRSSLDIDEAIRLFECKKADSVISVTEPSVPLEWHRKVDSNGVLRPMFPDFNALKNRQDYEETFIPNGAIFIFDTNKLKQSRNYYMEKTYPYIMPQNRSVDIDTEFDFKVAELLLQEGI